jgi:hypothetical protein
MNLSESLAPGACQTLTLNAGAEIFCTAGVVRLTESPHFLGDLLCSHSVDLFAGQGWRVDGSTVLSLQTDSGCQFKRISGIVTSDSKLTERRSWLKNLLSYLQSKPAQPADS